MNVFISTKKVLDIATRAKRMTEMILLLWREQMPHYLILNCDEREEKKRRETLNKLLISVSFRSAGAVEWVNQDIESVNIHWNSQLIIN